MPNTLSRATLGRLPLYLQYIHGIDSETVSAAQIARSLGLGEVQVRKDLASVCRAGMPKVGYPADVLRQDVEKALGVGLPVSAVVVGAGRLGTALIGYEGFQDYGMKITAAFDIDNAVRTLPGSYTQIYPMRRLSSYCRTHRIRLGILTVPASSAQKAADAMVDSGITAILNFAPCNIHVPPHVTVEQENIALSLAYLKIMATESNQQVEEEKYGKQIV